MTESRREFLAEMAAAGAGNELAGRQEKSKDKGQEPSESKSISTAEGFEFEQTDLKQDLKSFSDSVGEMVEALTRMSIESQKIVKNKEMSVLVKAQDGMQSLSAKRRNSVGPREMSKVFEDLAAAMDEKKLNFNPDQAKNIQILNTLLESLGEAMSDLSNVEMPKSWAEYDQENCNESMDEVSKNMKLMFQKVKTRIIKLGGEAE